MKSKWAASTLVSAALLAACSDTPNMKKLDNMNASACIDGMSILFNIEGKASRVAYTVLSEGTDQEITDWLWSNRDIAYATWSNKFYMKEVNRKGEQITEEFLTYQLDSTEMYEFSLPECM